MAEEEIEKETSKQEARRMYAAISYAFVLFVIGLPVWWYTTKLYRMALPDERMQLLGTAPVKLSLNIYMAGIAAPSTTNSFHGDVANHITDHFSQSDILNVSLQKIDIQPEWIPKSLDDVDVTAARIPVNIGDIYLVEWPKAPESIVITSHRVLYFTSATTGAQVVNVLSKWILQEQTLSHMVHNMQTPGREKQDAIIRRRITAAGRHDIMITVINPDPEMIKIDWDPKNATLEYLKPFTESISHIMNFNLKSQWLYYVSIGDKIETMIDRSLPEWNEKRFALFTNQLPYLITMFEKKLSSHISENSCLNLILYAAHCKQAPLHIYDSKGMKASSTNAFLSPRWGGVAIINPEADLCKDAIDYKTQAVISPDTNTIMTTFITQLRQLVGIQELESTPGIHVMPLKSLKPRQWELDALLRLRALEQLVSARLTLKSLAELLTKITTIVINDEVGTSIHSAVANAEVAALHLQEGQLEEAFEKSRIAFLSSETAFYDPSLLALLYFPDDQKYAIYIPLFLPIMIPVIMSLNPIRKWLFKKANKPKTD